MTMYKMKEKIVKRVYFVVLFLILFFSIALIHNHSQERDKLNSLAENSYQEMINHTRENMFQEYKIKYGISEKEFTEYWEEYKSTEEFRILELRYKEEFTNNYLKKYPQKTVNSFWINSLILILKIIGSPLNWVLSAIIIFGYYFLIKLIYNSFFAKKEKS